MLYKKEGFPEEGEIVICKVTSVQYHSVFAELIEYGSTGMLHISEVSPGRIRNLRDYVTEGKIIICKVLRVKKDRGHIDLSLRRVNEQQRKRKINQQKQEQIAEKIIEYVAKQRNTTTRELFNKIKDKIFENHETVYEAFEEVLEDKDYLSKIGVPKDIANDLTKLILERIKPSKVVIKRKIDIRTYESNGVELIKKALIKHEKENVNLYYAGGGRYIIEITSSDYKEGEKELSKIIDEIEKDLKKAIVTISK